MSQIEEQFGVPDAIKDFLFDLHDAVRRSTRMEEVQRLYETKLKEITDKFFSQSPWPESKVIASEVGNDEGFLVLYRYDCALTCWELHVFIPTCLFTENWRLDISQQS